MAKYKIIKHCGVFNTETKSYIPSASNNNDWKDYLQWVDDGNTPDPQFTSQEILDNELTERQGNRIKQLKEAIIDQFDLIIAIYQVGVANGAWVAGDFTQEIRDKAAIWKSLVDDYNNEV